MDVFFRPVRIMIPGPAFSFVVTVHIFWGLLVALPSRHLNQASSVGKGRHSRGGLVFALSRCMLIELFARSLVFEGQIGSLTLSPRRTCGSSLLSKQRPFQGHSAWREASTTTGTENAPSH